MILQNILSIFVLSLCLATLFITLVTYFLYRVKQLFKLNQKSDSQFLEGVFFKKHAPHIIFKQKEKSNEFENKLSDKKTLTRFLAIVCGIIFICFIVSYIFSYFRLGEKTIDSKSYEKLLEKGLLKEYQLNSNIDNTDLIEYINDQKKSSLEDIYTEIKNKKIGLFKNNNDKNQNLQFQNWANYFRSKKIDFKLLNSFSNTKGLNIVIIPQSMSLSKKLKDEIEEMLMNGVGVIATGPISYLDGLGFLNNDHFAEKIFGVEFRKNIDLKNFYPTAFEGDTLPWLEVAPGLILNYFPTNNNIVAITKRGVSSVYESNTQSQPKNYINSKDKIIRSLYTYTHKARVAWLALDPPNNPKINPNDAYYVELLLAKSMQWVMKIPIASVSLWKNGANSVFVPSIQIEDDSDYGLNYLELFRDNNFPVTVLIPSDQIQKNQKIIEEESNNSSFFKFFKDTNSILDEHSIEFATMGENDSVIQGNSLQYQFQNIQSSRILLEENTKNTVVGYKPPQLKLDTTTLNAVIQNKMLYMIGNESLFRLAPVYLDEGNLVYFPKSNLKEVTMYKTAKFHNTSLLLKSLTERFTEIENIKGASFYNFPTKSITAKNLESAVNKFLKYLKDKDVWKTNYIGLAKWWQEKENIKIKITSFPKLVFEIKNLNSHDVKNLHINFDDLNNEFDFLKNEKGIEIKKNKIKTTIIIKNILKNSTLRLSKLGDK